MRESRVYGVDDWRASRRCARRSFRLRGLAIAFVICVCASRAGPAGRRLIFVVVVVVVVTSHFQSSIQTALSSGLRGIHLRTLPGETIERQRSLLVSVHASSLSHPQLRPNLRLHCVSIHAAYVRKQESQQMSELSVCTRLAIGPIDSTVAGRPAPSTPADQTGRNSRGPRRCGALYPSKSDSLQHRTGCRRYLY